MPFTLGFETYVDLIDHYGRHGQELGALDPVDYERMADEFMGQPPADPALVLQCRRRNGDLVRYNQVTEEFGVLRRDLVIKSYYRADPQVHKCENNLVYFRQECRK